jgi:sugar-phosphatase
MIPSLAAMKSREPRRTYATLNAVLEVSAIIFDLDGVLADSSAIVDQAWVEWGDRHGVDANLILQTIPGKRTRDAIALLAPESDIDAEAARIVAREQSLVGMVTPIPGAQELLAQLPPGRWGVATSGTDAIARGRLAHTGLPIPEVLISAEMVTRGKPDPEVYARAAAALGFDAAACLVFEDAPSGVAAATAAGAIVVGVLTWAEPGLLRVPYTIPDLHAVRATMSGKQIRVELHEPNAVKT